MKRLLAIALLLTACAARADAPPPTARPAPHQPGQQAAPDAHRAHLLSVLREALDNQDISRQQYDEAVHWVNAAPCTGVENTLPAAYGAQLAAVLGTKGSTPGDGSPAHIVSVLRDGGWMIVLTESDNSDAPFRFYSGDPVRGAKPVTSWSGGATIFETAEIARWATKYAPGIPARLADCFAWTVTVGE